MKPQSILIDNVYNCFDRSGEFEPNDIALNAVADWLLVDSAYPQEMWEDDRATKAIGKLCVTRDAGDCAEMVEGIRKNAVYYASQLLEEHEEMLSEIYNEDPNDTFYAP